MAAHRYWRIEFKASGSGSPVGAEEIEMRESVGGADVTASGFASAQSQNGPNGPANAFSDSGGFWASDGADAAGAWVWIQQDFGAGNEKDIAEVQVQTDEISAIDVEGVRISYSDNGTDFTITDTYDTPQADNTTQQYLVTGSGGGGGSGTPSVNVSRGSTVIASGSTTATLTEGLDFTLTDTGAAKWFARITNTRHGGMGQISGGGNHNADQFTAHLEYSGNDVVITRQGTGLDCRVDWEVIEYVGPSGGANEWIVRERGVKTIAAAALSGSYATPGGLVSTGDGLIWITGQSTTNSTRNNVNDGQFMARFNGSNFEFERRNSTSNAEVSYAIVEYVGANWSVQQQEFTEGSANSDQTISPALSDFNTTVHHAQPTYGSGSGGLDDISARTDITSNSNINFLSNGDFANRRTSVWFLSNTGLTVQRFTGTMAGTGEEEVEDLTITAVTLAEASVTGTADSTGTGTAFPRGFVNYTLVDATTLRLRQSDDGQTSRYGLEVVEWPQDTASGGGGTGSSSGIRAASRVGSAAGAFAGTFSGQSSGVRATTRTGSASGTFEATFSGQSSGVRSGSRVGSASGTSNATFTGSSSGIRAGAQVGGVTGLFNGTATGFGAGVRSASRTGSTSGSFEGAFAGQSSGLRSTSRIGTAGGTFNEDAQTFTGSGTGLRSAARVGSAGGAFNEDAQTFTGASSGVQAGSRTGSAGGSLEGAFSGQSGGIRSSTRVGSASGVFQVDGQGSSSGVRSQARVGPASGEFVGSFSGTAQGIRSRSRVGTGTTAQPALEVDIGAVGSPSANRVATTSGSVRTKPTSGAARVVGSGGAARTSIAGSRPRKIAS